MVFLGIIYNTFVFVKGKGSCFYSYLYLKGAEKNQTLRIETVRFVQTFKKRLVKFISQFLRSYTLRAV